MKLYTTRKSQFIVKSSGDAYAARECGAILLRTVSVEVVIVVDVIFVAIRVSSSV